MLAFDSEEKWLSWKRKRRKTLVGFMIVGTVSGIDTSLVYSSLFLYLDENVKTDRPKLWYGIILTAFYVSSAISAAVGGRWVDRTGRIRLYIIATLCLQLIGFLIYAIPFHPLNVLAGRFLCGIGESFTSIVTGEVLRIYTGNEAGRALIALAAVFPMGFIMEPIFGQVFGSVHFCLKKMVVNHSNIVAVFMALYVFMVIIIVYFTVSDCSNELDLKHYQSQQAKNNNEDGPEISDTFTSESSNFDEIELEKPLNITQQIPVKYILRTFSKNVDAALLLISSFVLTFATHIAVGVLPLIIADEMEWNRGMHILLAVYGVGALLTLAAMSVYNKSKSTTYYSCIISVTCHIVAYIILLIFSILQRNFTRDIAILISFITISIFMDLFEMFSAKMLLGALVPSQIQSFTEGLRDGMCTCGVILASILTPFVLSYITWLSAVLIFTTSVIALRFVYRKKYFMNPKELSFSY